MKNTLRFSPLAILLIFGACSKEIDYRFIVQNPTSYNIDELQFSCAVEKHSVSVSKKDTSDVFSVTYKKAPLGGAFSEPLLCLTVLTYSDSNGSYSNTIGGTWSMSDLKKKGTNTIEMIYSPSKMYPTNKFDYEIK